MRRDFRDLDLMEVLQEANPFMSFGPGASPNSIDEAVREERERARPWQVERSRSSDRARERERGGHGRGGGIGGVLFEVLCGSQGKVRP